MKKEENYYNSALVVDYEFFRVSRIILTLGGPGYLEYPTIPRTSLSKLYTNHFPLRRTVTECFQAGRDFSMSGSSRIATPSKTWFFSISKCKTEQKTRSVRTWCETKFGKNMFLSGSKATHKATRGAGLISMKGKHRTTQESCVSYNYTRFYIQRKSSSTDWAPNPCRPHAQNWQKRDSRFVHHVGQGLF
jgi:hypothetical protein